MTISVAIPATRAIKNGFWFLWLGLRAFFTRGSVDLVVYDEARDDWERRLRAVE